MPLDPVYSIIISKDEIVILVTEPLDQCKRTAISNFTLLHTSVKTAESTSVETETHSWAKLKYVFKVKILSSCELTAAQQIH